MAKKVLIVSTSADKLGDHPTGLWIEELAAPYRIFKEAGYDVTVASVKGGKIPIDATSQLEMFYTTDAKNFESNPETASLLENSPALATLLPDITSFDAIFLPGGHGTCVDFDDAAITEAVDKLYAAGKVVSAVCHGPTGLVLAKKPDGEPLVKGLKVSGFTDAEEEDTPHKNSVPYLLESKLRELGADFQIAPKWSSFAVVDGNLVTGQNPQSSEAVGKKVVELLG